MSGAPEQAAGTTSGTGSRPIRGLIFDMDGLLIDSEPLSQEATAEFLRRHGHELTDEVQRFILGRRIPESIAFIVDRFRLPGQLDDLVATYHELRLAALRGNLRPMPGAAEVITFAREAGVQLALATSNLRLHVDPSLVETALAGLFDAEVTGDDVERGKPAPDIFLLAAERLGLEPGVCVVLEDAPNGILAATAAGMRTIWVPPAGGAMSADVRPDAVLPDLLAVIPWLEAHGVRRPLPAGVGGST